MNQIKTSNDNTDDNNKIVRSVVYRKIMRFLTIFGGSIGFLYIFLKLYNNESIQNIGFGDVIFINCGLVIAGFTIITALKPDNLIPWHWITLITLAVLTTIFIHLLPALLILITGIYKLIKEL